MPRPHRAVEAVLERRRDFGSHARQRQEAVSDIAGRQNVVLLAQNAGAAAVVGGRDHRRDVAVRGEPPAQAGQNDGQPASTAYGDDARRGP